MQQELPDEIAENSSGEEKLRRLRMGLQNQNEQSFISCLFLLAEARNSSKEDNLGVRASKKQLCSRAPRVFASVSSLSVYMISDTLKGRLRLAPERASRQQGRRSCLKTCSVNSGFTEL